MKIFSKKRTVSLLVAMIFLIPLTMGVSYAQKQGDDAEPTSTTPGATVLPSTTKSVATCEDIMRYVDSHLEPIMESMKDKDGNEIEGPPSVLVPSVKSQIAKKEQIQLPLPSLDEGPPEPVEYTDVLACAIKTGSVKMWMVPFFIRYILEFIIGLAGLIAVGGIVYGGYLYLFAGLSDDKDKGKNAIKNGILGLVLVMTAWAIVNIVISLATL